MKKRISFSTQGHRADIGQYIINRILPNSYAQAVGPFVFLDHLLPAKHSPDEPIKKVNGTGAHPHRGIATLTYVLNGEANHFDSYGNHAIVNSGGAQWMKAGNGIIHDEVINVDPHTSDLITHAFQFWINLPAKQKSELPEYLAIQANEVPQLQLGDDSGWLKVIVGEYENIASIIPNYTKQFLYHIHLNPGKQFSLDPETGLEYAAFLPAVDAIINDMKFSKGDFIMFDTDEGIIEMINYSAEIMDIIVFGGEKYSEPIVVKGPFVMNSELEITQAYKDSKAGKYGKINLD